MINDNFIIYAFEPLWLTVENIGPFRGQPYQVDFTDADNQPCNLFLLMSKNGQGKTTLLEIMRCLMQLLKEAHPTQFGHEDLDYGEGRVQWDLRVKLNWQGQKHNIVLSLLAGSLENEHLKRWTDAHINQYGATAWHPFGYQRHALGNLERIGNGDELVDNLLENIRAQISTSPEGVEVPRFSLPTLLYFSAYRDIERITRQERTITKPKWWGYYPVHDISIDGGTWNSSLDNLLVWLKWLDDGRFEQAQRFINERVFNGEPKFIKDIRRDPPEAIVINEGHQHRLDQLSSGEKSLVQMFLRISTHLTSNTFILIDDLEGHLHSIWQHGVLRLLKELVREHPGVTVIASTHSREILEAFPMDIPEQGVRKGGEIILMKNEK
jgi:ABC-type lipoprotein export system ATPase subunit